MLLFFQIKNEGDIDINLTLKDLKAGHHVTKVMISDIFLMMGRELENLEEAPAGSIVGKILRICSYEVNSK